MRRHLNDPLRPLIPQWGSRGTAVCKSGPLLTTAICQCAKTGGSRATRTRRVLSWDSESRRSHHHHSMSFWFQKKKNYSLTLRAELILIEMQTHVFLVPLCLELSCHFRLALLGVPGQGYVSVVLLHCCDKMFFGCKSLCPHPFFLTTGPFPPQPFSPRTPLPWHWQGIHLSLSRVWWAPGMLHPELVLLLFWLQRDSLIIYNAMKMLLLPYSAIKVA